VIYGAASPLAPFARYGGQAEQAAATTSPASHNFCFPEGMLERILRAVAVILISCLVLPGCAHFTKSGRQQLAYARYVKKCSHNRVRLQTKFKKVRMPKVPDPSDYKVNTAIVESPQSVTAAESQSGQ
jgi:hypothetical protein